MDWFLYDIDLRRERVNVFRNIDSWLLYRMAILKILESSLESTSGEICF